MWEKEKPAVIFLCEKWKLLYFLLYILFSLLFGKKNSDHNNDLSISSIDDENNTYTCTFRRYRISQNALLHNANSGKILNFIPLL